MRSLEGLKTKIGALLAARRELAARPHVVAYLPRNGREPADAPAGQFTTRPALTCSIVHYDPAAPPAELAAAPTIVSETETPSQKDPS
ncbi:MAG: hypothetical protein ABSF35_14175 [Polyangia bacterium]|jgi:hypothetical protein